MITTSSILLAGPDEDAALFAAAARGELEEVEEFLSRGANVEHRRGERNRTSLMEAAVNGHVAVVGALLDAGAKINTADELGMTALLLAAGGDESRTIPLLLEHGADVNMRSKDGHSALMSEVRRDYTHTKNVQLLIAAGADVDAQNDHGVTALTNAATSRNLGTLMVLLEAGADWAVTDEQGHNALDLAIALDRTGNVLALLDRGARPTKPNLAAPNQRRMIEMAAASASSKPVEEKRHEYIRLIVPQLADQEYSIAEDATEAIAYLGADSLPEVFKLLAKEFGDWSVIKSQRMNERQNRIFTLAKYALGKIGRPAVPALAESLSSPQAITRRIAASALAHMGPTAAQAASNLKRATRDQDPFVSETARMALEGIARPALHQPVVYRR